MVLWEGTLLGRRSKKKAKKMQQAAQKKAMQNELLQNQEDILVQDPNNAEEIMSEEIIQAPTEREVGEIVVPSTENKKEEDLAEDSQDAFVNDEEDEVPAVTIVEEEIIVSPPSREKHNGEKEVVEEKKETENFGELLQEMEEEELPEEVAIAGNQEENQENINFDKRKEKKKYKLPRKAKAIITKPNGQTKKIKIKKKSAFGIVIASMLKMVFVIFCLGLIVGSIVLVQVTDYMAESTAGDGNLLDLDNLRLNLTSYIMAPNPNNPNAEAEGDYVPYQELIGPQHRIWVEWEDIPENLVNAVIAIEDREFYEHRGVSIRRSAMAAVNMFFPIFSDSEFGASTIEQQLIKNLTGDDETDYTRKLREMYRAWGLDARYSKEMIMEAYLNTISLSGTIAGVQAGARDYFGKDVSELTLAECATIAGITRAPGYYDPFTNPENALTRRNVVLKQMSDTGKITKAEYDEACAEPLGVERQNLTVAGVETTSTFSYFSDAVFMDVVNDLMEQYGYTDKVARNLIYTGGLQIQSTVDINLQNSMEEVFEHGYDDTEDAFFTNLKDPWTGRSYKSRLTVKEDILDSEGNVVGTKEILPQAAMTTIDYSGAVRGVVGGIGEKTGDLVLNRATQSPRQIGSTMKPIGAYAPAIDQGIVSYSSMVMDSGVLSRNPSAPKRNAETGGIVYDWPKNFSNSYRNSTMPVVSAVAESTNTVAVRVGLRVGVENIYDFLTNSLEISTLVKEGNVNDMGPSALILGGLTYGVTTKEVAGAYQIFGNGGEFNSVHTYTRVLDSQGNVILEPDINHNQAISPEASFVMNRLLYTVLHNGIAPGVYSTASGMALEGEMESVAKTGTTSDDVDRWFIGLTPYYVTAVWWGYDDPKYDFNNKWSPSAKGNIPPLLWKTIMEKQQENMPVIDFPEMPEGVVYDYYCATTGERAGKYCPKSKKGYFIENEGEEYCTVHTTYQAPAAESVA